MNKGDIIGEEDNFIHLKGGSYPLGEENIPIELSSFTISPTQVTYGEMKQFALENNINPLKYHYEDWGEPDDERVAVQVNWFDAIRYCNWLSKQRGLSPAYTIYGDKGVLNPEYKSYWDDGFWSRVGYDISQEGYRLPTVAEWEYAASGYETLGKKQVYPGTDELESLEEYAWFEWNSGKKAHHTATLKPNANGIYDMGGNVCEWCFDEYKEDIFVTFKNQKNPFFQSKKIPHKTLHSLRGGSFGDYDFDCDVSGSMRAIAHFDGIDFGFRLVRTL